MSHTTDAFPGAVVLPPGALLLSFGVRQPDGTLLECYTATDGLYRVAAPGERVQAVYPVRKEAYPHGVPLVRCRLTDA